MANMPRPDASLKEFFSDNEVFASLFNDVLFNGSEVIVPSELKRYDTAHATTVKGADGNYVKIQRYRDIAKEYGERYVILGIEDQSHIHYAMPVRKMLYDALDYAEQIKCIDFVPTTVDERLSGAIKGTKLMPVLTVVFYTGETVWDGPRSLHDMLTIDETIKPFIPDYPLYVIDAGHDNNCFDNQKLKQLQTALSDIYSGGNGTDTEISADILALAGILVDDKELYYLAEENKGGSVKMCEALKQRDAAAHAEGIEKGIAKGRIEGRIEGRTEGRTEGRIETILELVRDGLLTISNAAIKLGITEEEFCKKYPIA